MNHVKEFLISRFPQAPEIGENIVEVFYMDD
jgi:hypothetical protein